MKKISLSLVFVFCLMVGAFGQRVDSVSVYSRSMNKNINALVITPEGYDAAFKQNYPVLYLLHGYSGNHKSWISIQPNLAELAGKYGMIVVCPDAQNSWYWDSPGNSDSQYETFVSKELTAYVDSHYKTNPSRQGRAVTGLSMGGHGGLWLGIRNQDVFGACGSMSGGVDILPFPDNWKMKDQLGEYAENPEVWLEHTVMNQLYKVKPGELAIIFDCGTSDFFYEVNKALHEKMLYLNIRHDYIERPGTHNAAYWENAVEFQMLYFSRYFRK